MLRNFRTCLREAVNIIFDLIAKKKFVEKVVDKVISVLIYFSFINSYKQEVINGIRLKLKPSPDKQTKN